MTSPPLSTKWVPLWPLAPAYPSRVIQRDTSLVSVEGTAIQTEHTIWSALITPADLAPYGYGPGTMLRGTILGEGKNGAGSTTEIITIKFKIGSTIIWQGTVTFNAPNGNEYSLSNHFTLAILDTLSKQYLDMRAGMAARDVQAVGSGSLQNTSGISAGWRKDATVDMSVPQTLSLTMQSDSSNAASYHRRRYALLEII